MKIKKSQQSKPVGDQGGNPNRNSLSLNDETRRQGEDFRGHHSQARSSPSENLGALRKQGTFLDKQGNEETHQTRVG